MATRKPEAGNKTYILELKNGDTRKITIPGNWKITYGSVAPYTSKNMGGGGPQSYALRLYEGSKENLRAVMTDVVSIRDADINVLEKRTTVQRKGAQKQTSQGMRDVVIEARMTEWVDPDAEESGGVPSEFLKLPRTTFEDE